MYPRLGSYTTFDCPTAHEDEAYDWLQEQFEKIGGYVRRVSNPHDFGSYSSFEVDYPAELEDIIECDDYGDDCDCEDCKLMEKQEAWHDKANEVESNYSKKFEQWL